MADWKYYTDYREIGNHETEQIIEGILKNKQGTEFFIKIYHTIEKRNNNAHIIINVLEEGELQISKSCHDTPDYVRALLKEIFEQLKTDGYWLYPPEKMLQKLCENSN